MTNRTLLYFYPRSPCGERPAVTRAGQLQSIISIHALLAESDVSTKDKVLVENAFLSTLSLRRATQAVPAATPRAGHFYPRSPCGERHLPQRNCAAGAKFLSTLSLRRATITLKEYAFRHGNFYPRSPCGERRFSFWRCTAQRIFLSTLSLRRATLPGGDRPRHAGISIHALLAESDGKLAAVITGNGAFLSTLSLRRATVKE